MSLDEAAPIVPTVYLIDGSGFIFRAFHALPPLSNPEGTPVGAVYGFCNILLRFMEKLQHNHVHDFLGVVFDAGRQTFRQKIYPDYKAHRPDAPAELVPQFALIREACDVLSVPYMEASGFEADDLIASYALAAKQKGYQVVIVSSDKDFMQLVDASVQMLDPIKNRRIGTPEVFEKFGVEPGRVIDVQALMGDSSDNVPGVPGIGPKTAAELIQQFGTLEQLLQHAHTIKQTKRRESLQTYAEQARISKLLVTLDQQVPLPLDFEQLQPRQPDPILCQNFFQKHGFKTLLNKFKSPNMLSVAAPSPSSKNYERVDTMEKLEEWIQLIHQSSVLAIDTETTGLNIQKASLVGISLAVEQGDDIGACYIPLAHQSDEPQLSLLSVTGALNPFLTDPGLLKVGHNLKYDLGILAKYDLTIDPITDTMLMSYCLDAGKNGHGMDELASRHLNHQTIRFEDVAGSGKNQKIFDQVPLDQATPYAAEDAEITLRLYQFFTKRLQEEGKSQLYQQIERPLIPVIVRMEQIGIKIDPSVLKNLGKEFGDRLAILETEIYKLAGRDFNIGSPKQLGEILFDEWSLPGGKKTKTGAYGTDAGVLEALALQGHNLPARILDWRGLAKLKSTYVDGLLAAMAPETHRIHTSFSLATTTTGRLASSDPNLQNIPIRTEDGRKIRQAFIPEKGMHLVSLDYSQIELRLLAHKAKVEPLIDAFQKGEDVHKATASQIFGIPLSQVNPEQRRQAKTINFGIIYGISAFGLGQQLGIPTSQAADIIKVYFARYPGIQTYMEVCKEQARSTGYVETLFGRRCYVPGINDKNGAVRGGAERQAINAPLQGSNADIIKKAMIRIDKILQTKGYSARLLLQVHDELLFEIPLNEIDALIPVLKQTMEDVITLSVPLVVGVGIGDNWDQAH
ncbi:DNA polymerase I [Candidatus Finniella inopinata]|uniref:DNA polymerase I n=1 Tax=Candidatus Finniella inopinata TaxID=1696036 RepID=A0A4Q7DKL8_9PROT|nr:DNA polymerase I [Candidatus Finniella inopinata]RZI46869.1 DNA polymerase I [Candidatus Finniella inopinata]